LINFFSKAKVAVHSMKHEHFGIAVVELMSSGIITIAHNSAGPKGDIIGVSPKTVGYLADKQEDYAFFVRKAMLNYGDPVHKSICEDSRIWVKERFGLESFDFKFIAQIEKLM